MKLILGLGNPGDEYSSTRHNVGFLALDAFADAEDAEGSWSKKKDMHADVRVIKFADETVVLAKPQTFMNASGSAAQALVSFYKLDQEDVLIVHDDMDIDVGRMKFTNGGSAAGHNGVQDIQDTLAIKDIARLRIGIGRPVPPMTGEHWVLGKLTLKDLPKMADIVEAMKDWIEGGVNEASNNWN
ncbi:MAG: aminoacyl-tRNA hydrolase [Patescibacteria group bacterium]